MRWLIFISVILLCGCMETQKEMQREYVCPDGSVVDAPGKCPLPQTTVTTTTTITITTTTTTITTQSTSTTNPDPCAGLSKNKRASCIAVEARNASLCPYKGLEFSDEFLTDSLFLSLGNDIFSADKKETIMDVFMERKTCVMVFIDRIGNKTECVNFPFNLLCQEKFIVEANDTRLCDALTQGPLQQGCYFALISLKGNSQACFRYPEYQDCLIKIAAATDDFAPCRQVYLSESRGSMVPDCINGAKLMKCELSSDNTVDCCAQLPDDMMAGCYAAKLKQTNVTQWCKKRVSTGKYEDDWSCFANLAKQKLDTGICDRIGAQGWRDDCYQSVISETGNRTECSRIKDDKKRHDCTWGKP